MTRFTKKPGTFAGILAAAGITPEAYRDPEIQIDPAGVADYVAKYLNLALGKFTLPNTVFKNEIDSAGHGFNNYFYNCQPFDCELADHAKLLTECVQPAAEAISRMLSADRGDGFLAFTEHSLMTKRKTTSANGRSGNVIATCKLWVQDRRVTMSISVNALTNNPSGSGHICVQ